MINKGSWLGNFMCMALLGSCSNNADPNTVILNADFSNIRDRLPDDIDGRTCRLSNDPTQLSSDMTSFRQTETVVHCLSKFDGGELEDAYILIGKSIDFFPEETLRLVLQRSLSVRDLLRATAMLPSALVDNPTGKIERLRLRRKGVVALEDSELTETRAAVLKVIDAEISLYLQETSGR